MQRSLAFALAAAIAAALASLSLYVMRASGNPGVRYATVVTSYAPVNSSTLSVRFTIRNTGKVAGTPDCTVNVDGGYSGFDQELVNVNLRPGQVISTGAEVEVQAAGTVNDVAVGCY